jgi:hypothetical protein
MVCGNVYFHFNSQGEILAAVIASRVLAIGSMLENRQRDIRELREPLRRKSRGLPVG